MLSFFLKAKLHNLTVTDAQLGYQGSLTLDEDFMDAVGIREFEKILVSNIANGERFETYVIKGRRGSKDCCLNGATAHKGKPGDHIIVFTFCMLDDDAAGTHKPRVAIFGEDNEIVRTSRI